MHSNVPDKFRMNKRTYICRYPARRRRVFELERKLDRASKLRADFTVFFFFFFTSLRIYLSTLTPGIPFRFYTRGKRNGVQCATAKHSLHSRGWRTLRDFYSIAAGPRILFLSTFGLTVPFARKVSSSVSIIVSITAQWK